MIDNLRADGTQRILVHLVRGLGERGHVQHIFCLNACVDPTVVQRLEENGANITVVGKWQVASGIGFIQLAARFAKFRPDVVQTFLPVSDVVGRTAARLASVPAIVSSIRATNRDKKAWQFVLDRVTMRWAKRVIFNSRSVIPFAIAREGVRPAQVVFIPNGVRLPSPQSCGKDPKLLAAFGVCPSAPLVGTVGRLYPQKGHTFLLMAIKKVIQTLPETVLLIVGDGPLRPNLEAKTQELGIQSSVRFLGYRSDVAEVLPCLDLYVQSSLWEGMPNAVMEAMATGLPVVATKVDGTVELIEHGRSGWLVEPANPDALFRAIVDALTNKHEASRVGKVAAERMRAFFSLEAMISAYEELYRELSTR